VERVSVEGGGSPALALGGSSPSLDGLRWIGVDEVSRTGGHVYFTVVTDLQAGRVVESWGRSAGGRWWGWSADLNRACVNAIAAAVPAPVPPAVPQSPLDR